MRDNFYAINISQDRWNKIFGKSNKIAQQKYCPSTDTVKEPGKFLDSVLKIIAKYSLVWDNK